LEVGKIVVDDVAPEELAGDPDLQVGVAVGQEAPRPDPGVEGLRREPSFQGGEKAVPEAIGH
jgi:hypothetical protein